MSFPRSREKKSGPESQVIKTAPDRVINFNQVSSTELNTPKQLDADVAGTAQSKQNDPIFCLS